MLTKPGLNSVQVVFFCQFVLLALLRNRLDPLERTFQSLQKGPFRLFIKNILVSLKKLFIPFRKNILVSLKKLFIPFRKNFLVPFKKTVQTFYKELFSHFRCNLCILNLLDCLYKKTPKTEPLFYYLSFKVYVQFITIYCTNNINAILKKCIFLLYNVNAILKINYVFFLFLTYLVRRILSSVDQ